MNVLLVSTYDLGNQPTIIASHAAQLVASSHEIRTIDLAIEDLDSGIINWAQAIGISIQMHTSATIAKNLVENLRSSGFKGKIIYFGLSAHLGEVLFSEGQVDAIFSGESETAFSNYLDQLDTGKTPANTNLKILERIDHLVPLRSKLRPLEEYSHIIWGDRSLVVGPIETSRGCSHGCLHCPVPQVYNKRVRKVDLKTLINDIDQLVEMGAEHISFNDPDFLNIPTHSDLVVTEMRKRHPNLTFDATIKIEHIVKYKKLMRQLKDKGLILVQSAFETMDDEVLALMEKGHNANDAKEAIDFAKSIDLTVRPSWIPFSPWTTYQSIADIVNFSIQYDVLSESDPIQWTIKLLVPKGSLLLDSAILSPIFTDYDEEHFTYRFDYKHAALDNLQQDLARFMEDSQSCDDSIVTLKGLYLIIKEHLETYSDSSLIDFPSEVVSNNNPRRSESWFCCAEPTALQLKSATV
ncbi:MAG: radical SAM protein [Acidimicrobiales bacterium]|nr:radical SAM protein [Acidimicrobiales bacterium]